MNHYTDRYIIINRMSNLLMKVNDNYLLEFFSNKCQIVYMHYQVFLPFMLARNNIPLLLNLSLSSGCR